MNLTRQVLCTWIREHGPVVSIADIAKAFSCGPERAGEALRRLRDTETIESTAPGVYRMAVGATILPSHVKHRHAKEIADEMIMVIMRRRSRSALFISPNGEYAIAAVNGRQCRRLLADQPLSLVGVYDAAATKTALIDDIEDRCRAISATLGGLL